MPNLSEFFSQLLSGLSSLGMLHLVHVSSELQTLRSELILGGFTVLSVLPEEGLITAQKPAYTPWPLLFPEDQVPQPHKDGPCDEESAMDFRFSLWAHDRC